MGHPVLVLNCSLEIATCFSTEVDDDAAPDTSNSDNRRDRDNVQRGHKGLIIFNALAVAEHPPEEVVALIKKYVRKLILGQNAMAAGGTLANMPAPRAPHAARGLP